MPVRHPGGVPSWPGLETLHRGLLDIETGLADLWTLALAVDDSELVGRLVRVSHDVQRATVALVEPSSVIDETAPMPTDGGCAEPAPGPCGSDAARQGAQDGHTTEQGAYP